jgi:hypothetical protein
LALAVALPAAAAACTVSTANESQPFAAYGDSSLYTLAPGGSFVSGASGSASGWMHGGSFVSAAPGWRLNNARVQSGGSSFPDALTINPNGSAISAPFCASSETPTFRFFAQQASANSAEMNVEVLWNASGQPQVSTAGEISLGSSWAPSPVYNLGSMLPDQSGETFWVRIEFVPAASGGAVQIDDLYVDPYSS